VSKIILVDFVITNRFHCGILIPYLNSFLKKRGVNTIYLRSGLLAEKALTDKNEVVVDNETINGIKEFICKEKIEAIIFSHKPDKRVLSILKKYCKKTYYMESLDNSAPNIDKFYTENHISESEIYGAIPDFSFININKGAINFRPLPHLLLYNECNYQRSIKNNPYFEDLRDLKGVKEEGCTFCLNTNYSGREIFDDRRVRESLISAINTTPWNGFRKRARIMGEIISRCLDRFFEIVVKSNIDNTDFLFNFRLDNFLRNRAGIERALRLIEKSGNRFYLALVGIESFSNDALLRFNKGFEVVDILRFLSYIFSLKKRYLSHFDFAEYGGFSLILFTPWTTLEELRYNYHIIKMLGIERLCGKLFSSRLRLYKELPLYYLAKKDGLITKDYRISIFDTASKNFYKDEIPWRYRDKRLEKINEYLLRRENINLDEAIVYLNKKVNIQIKKVIKAKYLKDNFEVFCQVEYEFMKEYRTRKVGKLEVSNKAELREKLDILKGYFPDTLVMENKTGVNNLTHSILYSLKREHIDNMSRSISLLENQSIVNNEKKLLYRQVGLDLGYPDCCVRSYLQKEYYKIGNYIFSILRERIGYSSINPNLNPFLGNIFYVPCTFSCKKSEDLVTMRSGISRKIYRFNLADYGYYPIIYLLPFDPERSEFRDNLGYVVVEPLSDVSEEFSYRPLLYSGEDRRLLYILNANRVVMNNGIMKLYRDNKLIHTFCVEANIWYYKYQPDRDFWEAFCEAYYQSVISDWNTGTKNNNNIQDTNFIKLKKRIESNRDKMSFHINDILIDKNVVLLKIGDNNNNSLELRIQNRKEALKSYIDGEKYSVSLACTNINEDRIKKIISELLRIIENDR